MAIGQFGMNSFRKWNGKKIEDWGSVMSDDAKSFYKAFKNYLKRVFPDAELIGFKPNHYDFSGFICQDGKYIYISHAIDRYKERVDFDDAGVSTGVLYRTAEGPKDYRGGHNNFCSINKLADCVQSLFDRMEPVNPVTESVVNKYSDDQIWRVEYYDHGTYRNKYVKGPDANTVIKKARVKNIEDLNPIDSDSPELKDKKIIDSVSLNEKLYNMDEIQDMVIACKNNSALRKKVLAGLERKGPLAAQDRKDIADVISAGDADLFSNYDSAVCDKFITSYERANESVDVNSMVDRILEGDSLGTVIGLTEDIQKVDFAGKKVSYVVNKDADGKLKSVDIGDGELKDSEGYDYFVHLEYDPKNKSWFEEIWYEDDHMSVKDWYDYTEHESMKSLRAIEQQIEEVA